MKRISGFAQTVGLALLALLVVQPLHVEGAGNTGSKPSGKLYRWVDEKGQVHYSDKIPPEYAGQQRDVLNNQGVKKQTIEGAKTPEQLAEEARQAKLQEEEKQRAEEQARRDRILLSTYTTEDEITMARDGKVAALDTYIKVTNSRVDKLKAQLDALRKRAEQTDASTPAGAKLQKDIAHTEQQIRENEGYVEAKHREQDELRARFEQDLQRYRELKTPRLR